MDLNCYGDCMATCEWCSVEFEKKKHNARFCCKAHGVKSRQRKAVGMQGFEGEAIRCGNCDKEFAPTGKLPKYCSSKCRTAFGSKQGNKRRRAAIAGSTRIKYSHVDLAARDGMDCSHCGCVTTFIDDGIVPKAHVDHIIPLSRGGDDAIYNAQILCSSCNIKKGNKVYPKDVDKANRLKPDGVEINILKAKASIRSVNTSGVTGVFLDMGRGVSGAWVARIEVDKKRIFLCSTSSKERAIRFRKEAERLLAKGFNAKEIKQTMSKYHA